MVEALRWGWVDSTVKVLDEDRSMMWFAPRRRRSVWTRYNKQRIARLEAEGRLEAPGSRRRRGSQANGMWTVMDSVEDLVVPDDLAAAFERHPGSREAYEGFSPSTRKQILGWIALARRARDPGGPDREGGHDGRRGQARPGLSPLVAQG